MDLSDLRSWLKDTQRWWQKIATSPLGPPLGLSRSEVSRVEDLWAKAQNKGITAPPIPSDAPDGAVIYLKRLHLARFWSSQARSNLEKPFDLADLFPKSSADYSQSKVSYDSHFINRDAELNARQNPLKTSKSLQTKFVSVFFAFHCR